MVARWERGTGSLDRRLSRKGPAACVCEVKDGRSSGVADPRPGSVSVGRSPSSVDGSSGGLGGPEWVRGDE